MSPKCMGEGLREIYTVRGALEEQATRIATARQQLRPRRFCSAKSTLMREAAVAGDVHGVIDHRSTSTARSWQRRSNRLLLNIWQSLQIETRTTITMLVEGLDLVEIADSHQPIVDAIGGGDAEHAARVAREHQDYFERLPLPARGEPHAR